MGGAGYILIITFLHTYIHIDSYKHCSFGHTLRAYLSKLSKYLEVDWQQTGGESAPKKVTLYSAASSGA